VIPPWSAPPERPALEEGEVHVWRASLSLDPDETGPLFEVLTDLERERAGRFRFGSDRARYIATRGCLRRILATYTDTPPERLAFVYGPQGKPGLAAPLRPSAIDFNVSHSGEIALLAFAPGRRIGVDVEIVRPLAADDERLSSLWLSETEWCELAAMDLESRTRAFYSAWTRKEAYLKARGEGLSLAPDRVLLAVAGELPQADFESAFEEAANDRWSLNELGVGPDYAAALAVEGHGWRLSCWQYPPGTAGP